MGLLHRQSLGFSRVSRVSIGLGFGLWLVLGLGLGLGSFRRDPSLGDGGKIVGFTLKTKLQ